MKKTFLILATLLMMGGAAFAGGDFDFGIGPKVGYQTAKLSYYRADIRSGFSNHFTFGIFGRVTYGRVYLQPEVLYFKTSNVFNVDVTGEGSSNLFNIPSGANVNLTLNQMNLQVPILFGVNMIDNRIIRFRAQVGPTANFVLQSKTLCDHTYSINEQDVQMSQQQQDAISKQEFDTKSISWGMQAGLGVDLLRRITLDVNYNFGLSRLFDNLNNTSMGEYFDFSKADNTKQGLFMVTVGFMFF